MKKDSAESNKGSSWERLIKTMVLFLLLPFWKSERLFSKIIKVYISVIKEFNYCLNVGKVLPTWNVFFVTWTLQTFQKTNLPCLAIWRSFRFESQKSQIGWKVCNFLSEWHLPEDIFFAIPIRKFRCQRQNQPYLNFFDLVYRGVSPLVVVPDEVN